ncbi:MAG: hypothetical protein J6W03_02920 [Bacteroidaceae bacterium]|nr:hypothetical protein [Bacteroidaceae bacterium]
MTAISETNFKNDFKLLSGFWDFHVKKNKILLRNEDIQLLGLKVTPHSCEQMKKLKWKNIQPNCIEYSSSTKAHNVKNFMWAIRCLEAHVDNIKEVLIDGVPFYRIEGFSKNNKNHEKLPTLMGYVECRKWKPYIKQVMTLIKSS